MHAERFWSYVLFVLLAGWAIMGAYPFGTPISGDDNQSHMSFVRVLQATAVLVMLVVCLVAAIISSFIFLELLKVRNIEEARTISAKRAARLSRVAPFGIFGFAAVFVRVILDYRSGTMPGFDASVVGVSAAFILLCIIVAVRNVLFIHHPPD